MNWTKMTSAVPPYDTRVLVRGKNQWGAYEYAIAFNQCYQPHCALTQIIELSYGNEPVRFHDVPFEVDEWVELE